MNICIAVLAHNEETGIERTLQDLLLQDLWKSEPYSTELMVVVNGTTDRTVAVSEKVLKEAEINARVFDLIRPGKANAWNQFIHDLSPVDTDIFILVDADIVLSQTEALRVMVETLIAHPEAVAVVDVPIKDLAKNEKKGAAARLSLSVSDLAAAGPPKLCGQLYAARAEALRKIFLPEPMLVEDGFIKAMLVTDAFTIEENAQRLVRAADVFHVYEAETKLKSIYCHEKRILIGSICNFLLFDLARELVSEGEDVGAWMKEQTEKNPEWFRRRIQEHFSARGVPKEIWAMVRAPWNQLNHVKGKARLRALPASLVRTGLNFVVAVGAVTDVKKGRLNW